MHVNVDERKVPAERLLVGDIVRAVAGGPQGKVTSNANGWTVVQYRRRRRHPAPLSLVPYQHGIERLIFVASPSRHDARHPGPAAGCVYCWTAVVGENEPVRYKAVHRQVLQPGDSVSLAVSVENATGEPQTVVGVEYGPMRLVTEPGS